MSAQPNQFTGLWNGPIDKNASSVINAIYAPVDPTIQLFIGSPVNLIAPTDNTILPNVDLLNETIDIEKFYGIAVAGDKDGIYPNSGSGFFPGSLIAEIGDGVRVCTQGRCVARLRTLNFSINIGDPLTPVGNDSDSLEPAESGDFVVARSLVELPQADPSLVMGPVDIQREGSLP